MPGGGSHGNGQLKVGKGQITDDGELTLCLMHALWASKGNISNTEIGRYYGKWMQTEPFDLGNTCKNSLLNADPFNPNPEVIKRDALKSEKSESNGALMRVTPIAVFWHRLEGHATEGSSEYKEWIYKAAVEDGSFTHCNKIVLFINGLYWYVISMIINQLPLKEVYDVLCEQINELNNEDISNWLEESKQDVLPSLKKHAGWIKHAFICFCRYLRIAAEETDLNPIFLSEFYRNWIVETLMGDGDTDTNACIVGGMVGAIVGFDNLPELAKERVLGWPIDENDEQNGIPRDDFLKPKMHAERLIQELYDLAPETLEII